MTIISRVAFDKVPLFPGQDEMESLEVSLPNGIWQLVTESLEILIEQDREAVKNLGITPLFAPFIKMFESRIRIHIMLLGVFRAALIKARDAK